MAKLPKQVLLDSCVMVDSYIKKRLRHLKAKKLTDLIAKHGITILYPSHAYFEFVSAILDEVRRNNVKALDVYDDILCKTQPIYIDQAFIRKYLFGLIYDRKKIDLKSGDMIYVAIALQDRLPLVTEDKQMQMVSKSLGVDVYSIDEFLNEVYSYNKQPKQKA